MSTFISKNRVVILAGVCGLALAACSSHSYNSTRYGGGPCKVNCMPAPMPVYYAPPQPQPQPRPLPPPKTVTLRPTPTPKPTPQPVTCAAGWMMGPSGVCLEIVTPPYEPPPVNRYPDPPKKPRAYKPKRK